MDLRPTCNKCEKVLSLEETRAIGNNKYLCKRCYEGTPAPSYKAGKVKPVADREKFFPNKDYECISCGFKFSRGPTTPVAKCPYCGREEIRQKIDDSFIS